MLKKKCKHLNLMKYFQKKGSKLSYLKFSDIIFSLNGKRRYYELLTVKIKGRLKDSKKDLLEVDRSSYSFFSFAVMEIIERLAPLGLKKSLVHSTRLLE